MELKTLIIKKLLLFYIGFASYITMEVLFRGYSNPLMGLCGGIVIVVLDNLNNKISWDMDILLQGVIGSLLVTSLEFFIGIFMINGYLPKIWDYSNMWCNYKGIICLPFSIVWVTVSILAIVVADVFNYYGFNELPVPYYKMFGRIIIRFKEKR